jgi:hypothetical protein
VQIKGTKMNRDLWKKQARWTLALALALAGVVLVVLGCSRNEGALPAGFIPTGDPDQDTFVLSVVDTIGSLSDEPDTAPDTISITRPECDTCTTSVTIDTVVFVVKSPIDTVVAITVLDRTLADGYRVYRRYEDQDAFAEAVDYVSPFGATFNYGYQFFQAVDRAWAPNRGADYLARATVLGKESSVSPITQIIRVPGGTYAELGPVPFDLLAPIDTLQVDSLLILHIAFNPSDPTEQIRPDSLKGFHWEPVPGAVRYVLSCIRSDGVRFLLIFTPPGGSTDLDLTQLMGTTPIHQILPLTFPSTFFWTVEAIDADSRVIGRVPGRQIFSVVPICRLFPQIPCPDD